MKGVVLPLAITLAIQALTSMAMIAPSVMAPVAAPEMGLSPQHIGRFVALENLCAMLAGLAGGCGRAYIAFCLLPALAGLRLVLRARERGEASLCAKP